MVRTTEDVITDDCLPGTYREVDNRVDRIELETLLKHFGGNQQAAAERLSISRVTLRTKLLALSVRLDRG